MISKFAGVVLLVFVFNFASSYPASDWQEVNEEFQYDHQPFEEEPYEVSFLRHKRDTADEYSQVFQPEGEGFQAESEIEDQPLIRERRQLFGGRNGPQQTIGFRTGPAWGSMSHSGGPITYNAGADFARNGHGLSGSLSHTPGIGGHGTVRGTVGLVNTPNHQVSAWAQHDRNFNKNMHRLGPETNSAGLNYQHAGGANAFLSGSKTPGFHSTGTVGGSVPLHTGKDSSLSLSGQTNFGHGMKPSHQIGLEYNKQF